MVKRTLPWPAGSMMPSRMRRRRYSPAYWAVTPMRLAISPSLRSSSSAADWISSTVTTRPRPLGRSASVSSAIWERSVDSAGLSVIPSVAGAERAERDAAAGEFRVGLVGMHLKEAREMVTAEPVEETVARGIADDEPACGSCGASIGVQQHGLAHASLAREEHRQPGGIEEAVEGVIELVDQRITTDEDVRVRAEGRPEQVRRRTKSTKEGGEIRRDHKARQSVRSG